MQTPSLSAVYLLIKSLFNTQVSGTELNCVPGGYNSGSLAYSGSFRVCLGREGQFNFVRFVQFVTTSEKFVEAEEFVPIQNQRLHVKVSNIDLFVMKKYYNNAKMQQIQNRNMLDYFYLLFSIIAVDLLVTSSRLYKYKCWRNQSLKSRCLKNFQCTVLILHVHCIVFILDEVPAPEFLKSDHLRPNTT